MFINRDYIQGKYTNQTPCCIKTPIAFMKMCYKRHDRIRWTQYYSRVGFIKNRQSVIFIYGQLKKNAWSKGLKKNIQLISSFFFFSNMETCLPYYIQSILWTQITHINKNGPAFVIYDRLCS